MLWSLRVSVSNKNHWPVAVLLLAALAFALPGCCSQKHGDCPSVERESAGSLAREAQLFAEFVENGQSTTHYTHAESGILAEQALRWINDNRQACNCATQSSDLELCATFLELPSDVARIPAHARDKSELAGLRSRISRVAAMTRTQGSPP
jgi:hypothetical protein